VPLHSVVSSTAVEEAAVEFIVEPLHSAANPAGSSTTLTETICLCVRV
jgi:hypothetical protein